MLEAFRLGGWGMYPTAIMGVFCVYAAVQYARRPGAANLLVVALLAVLTGLAGSLGFVTGVIKTLSTASSGQLPDPLATVVTGGIGESLHNIGLALALMLVAAITVTLGALRARPTPPAVPAVAQRHA